MARQRRIFGLALPIMMGMVSQNVLNLVDTAFVGRLGEDALAAVGMGGFANWLLGAALMGMGSGVQAMAARRLGEGKTGEVAVGLNAALLLAVGLGVPLACLGVMFAPEIFALLNDDPEVMALGSSYLAIRMCGVPLVSSNFAFRGFWNGTNRPRNYLMTLAVMHSINVVLDYGLIFGNLGLPKMGTDGAGLATLISIGCGTLFYIGLGWFQARDGGFLRFKGLREGLKTVARLSVPAGLQQTFFSAGFVLFFVIAGRVSTEALAASNILINLVLVCVLPGVGLGLAGASLVGQALGAGDREDAKRWGWEVALAGSVIMGTIGAVLALGAESWLSVFAPDAPEVVALAVLPLMLLGGSQVLDGLGVVLLNIIVGVGDTMAALVMNVLVQWVLFLPLAWLMAVHFEYGMIALWVGMVLYRLTLAVLVLGRYASGAWMNAKA